MSDIDPDFYSIQDEIRDAKALEQRIQSAAAQELFKMAEVRTVDPDTGAEKGTKLARYDLIPVGPLKQLAEHYGKGASKYADHNWRKGYDWSKSYAALQRHANQFWGGEDMDEELRSNHMVSVAFHAFALIEYCETMRNKDDRWTTIKDET